MQGKYIKKYLTLIYRWFAFLFTGIIMAGLLFINLGNY